MDIKKFIPDISFENKNLYYWLNIIFVLFFIFPVLGFLYFGFKYDILKDEYAKPFILGSLVYTFVGFTLLRKLFDKISSISKGISERVSQELSGVSFDGNDELQKIVQSFESIDRQFRKTSKQLQEKSSDISILKELSDLCYATLDPEEILYITLERSLMLANADIGSILIIDRFDSSSFVVKASIGLADLVKINDRVDFESSIAKYAIINKSPILVENIERETRFGRANRPHYGSKSFICMPIKTIKEVIGVLSISCSRDDKIFSQEDIEVLTPLLCNSAFTYENLRLISNIERCGLQHKTIGKIIDILNSSLSGGELLRTVLQEIQGSVNFEAALILKTDDKKPDLLTVVDLLAGKRTVVDVGSQYRTDQDSVINSVLKQESSLIISETAELINQVDRELLADQGLRSCMLAPLMNRGRVSGILALCAHQADIFYKNRELLDWLAGVLSLAVEQNNLSAAVLKRNREVETIRQIGGAIATSTFDISQVLKYTMDMIRIIMNVEAGSLALINGDELEFAVSFEIDVESLKGFRLKLGQGIAGAVAARGEPMIVNDVKKSTHFYAEIDKVIGFDTRSALCVPMISKGRVIGIIEVLNKIDGDFDDSDQGLLRSIAASVSIALENARLYKETVSMAEHERNIRQVFQKFVPKKVVDDILADKEAGRSVVEELKTLTLLNIDIRGFSRLVKKIGPQKTVALVNRFFSIMGGIVFKHQGIVDKYLGDGFLALFGAPVSSVMDAENAVSAALEMQAAVASVNEYVKKELGAEMGIGISIHTGSVVIGNIGFDMKMDYTVIGDSVNAVFRLQELTRSYPNGILISEAVARAARSRLELRETGESCDVDDALGALKVYELLGKHEEPS